MSNNAKPIALQTEMDKAVSALEGFLTPEEEKVEQPIEEETVEEIEESPEEDVLEEEFEDESEDELEDDDEETEDEDEEQTEVEEEQEQPELYTVKIDGIEQEVTLDELRNGYSRQQDYTRKTQKLAEEQKTLQQKLNEVTERDAIYTELLPKMEQQLQSVFGEEPNWDELYEQDPLEYTREKHRWDQKKEKLAAVEAEQKRLQQEQYEKQMKELNDSVKAGEQRLLEVVPEWQKAETAQAEKAEISQYAINSLEFTQEELSQVYDWRLLNVLRKAWLYDKTKEASKQKPTQKAKSRVARPGAVTKNKTVTPVKKAKQRLAKSGKVSDAAKVFEQLI